LPLVPPKKLEEMKRRLVTLPPHSRWLWSCFSNHRMSQGSQKCRFIDNFWQVSDLKSWYQYLHVLVS
jgi:hypothetical protein